MLTFKEFQTEISRMDSAAQVSIEDYRVIARLRQALEYEKGDRLDANESMNLLRSLTQFMNETYEVLIDPEFKFPQIAPMRAAGVADGVKQIGWYTARDLGRMKMIANGAQDLPVLGRDMEEKLANIRIAGAKVVWSMEDVAAAAFLGKNLPAEGGAMGRRAADRLHEDITATGDSQFGIGGLLSAPNDLTAYNSGTTVDWAGTLTTPAAKANFLTALIRSVSAANGSIRSANTLLLPTSIYLEAEDLAYGDSPNYNTILDFVEYTYRRRQLRVIDWAKLERVSTLSDKQIAVAYPFSFETLENMITNPFYMKPPKEDDDYNIIMGCFTKTAGVVIRQPKNISWAKLN